MQKLGILSGFFSIYLMAIVAQANSQTPECIYWAKQIKEIDQRIEDTNNKLKECNSRNLNCEELEQLKASLEDEKATTLDLIKNFCQ